MSNVIVRRTPEEMLLSMTRYLPGGELFEAAYVPGSNFNSLLAGLSGVLLDADNFIYLYNTQFIPDKTTVFIEEWESALGIPDDCFLISPGDTNESRRLNILVKLASLGVQTVNDFERLATIIGFDGVRVFPGMDHVGTDLVTNGDFSGGGTGWTVETGWTASASGLEKTNPGTATSAYQNFTTTADKTYIVTFDMFGRASGSLNVCVGGGASFEFNQNVTRSEPLISAGGARGIDFKSDDIFDGGVTNISVAQLDDDVITPRFTIVVEFPEDPAAQTFPLPFDHIFGTQKYSILECLYAKLKPANCDIVFEFL